MLASARKAVAVPTLSLKASKLTEHWHDVPARKVARPVARNSHGPIRALSVDECSFWFL